MSDDLTRRVNGITADPVVDALARASRYRPDDDHWVQPVAVLINDATIWVVARQSRRNAPARNMSNRFVILNVMGQLVWSKSVTSLSGVADILRHNGWGAAEVRPASDDTRRAATRLRGLLRSG